MTRLTHIVNGKSLSAEVEPRTSLVDLLREAHNLTGSHIGCEHGVCGACTLLIDGVPARGCITLAAACEGAKITTIEGLDDDEIAGELREAFKREHALQCGYCTPGMMVSARDIVLRLAEPDERAIRVALSGNLCRCTGYVGIVRATQSVLAARRARGIAAIADGGRKQLGPAGVGAAAATPASLAARAPSSLEAREPASAPIESDLTDWKPQTTLQQSFAARFPEEVVWAYFGRVAEVATCLPGVALEGEPRDGEVAGRIRVRVGPIAAEFHGRAHIKRDEATRTGEILGSGKDTLSQSQTKGMVRYAVKPGPTPGATIVELTIGYTLTGALAQFGRGGLAADVAGRLTQAFAANLAARLSQPAAGGSQTPPASTSEFNAGSLLFSVLADRVKRLFAVLTGRA